MHSAGEMDPRLRGDDGEEWRGLGLIPSSLSEGEQERGLLNPVGLYHRIQRA